MIYWLIAREVRILRGELSLADEWEVMVDLFYHKTLPTAADKDGEDEENADAHEEKAAEAKEGETE
jgi:small subunit ribosomal protein SAe